MLKVSEVIRIRGVKTILCVFMTSCAIEVTCGNWGSTFLVEHKNMALSRFLSGVLAVWLNSWQIIKIGQCILGTALVILLLPISSGVAAVGLFMAGFGVGPPFTNLNYLTPQNFGEDVSQLVIGVQMAASYVGIMLAPMFCGFLGQFIGMGIFPVYLLVFLCCYDDCDSKG